MVQSCSFVFFFLTEKQLSEQRVEEEGDSIKAQQVPLAQPQTPAAADKVLETGNTHFSADILPQQYV